MGRAGFGKDFVSTVILPDWWESECEENLELLPEIEVRVARFLGLPASVVSDPERELASEMYQTAHLRRVRDIDRDRLAPAIHSALRIAGAVIRNLRAPVAPSTLPPASGLRWRDEMQRSNDRVTLDDILADLWMRGIPVIPIDSLPAPSFQGLAGIVDERPVIVVGYKHDEPGRVAFLLAHEAGHIASAHCTAEAPVIDQDEEIASEDALEERADQFAIQVLTGGDEIPRLSQEDIQDFKVLAKQAADVERNTGADAGSIIFSWARSTGDYATATMATKALYRATGARRTLREYIEKSVDVQGAPQSDRELLRAVAVDQRGPDAAAG
jgi:hypothetical protein